MIYRASDKAIEERVNFKNLDQYLKSGLIDNGIELNYHFKVIDRDGREVYRCSDYSDEGSESSYSQPLFLNDPPARMSIVKIHFPGKQGLYFRLGQLYDSVDDLYLCSVDNVHLYDLYRVPPEEADGDEE